ncbi:hypothetical protein A8V23_05065 [Yersinia pestis]|uniref:Uncharacterized protein n=5 Tax=Yersinia pseudotuberculosis complex TaxID=1649845 RepID=A0AAX2I2P6_YERPE|nr:hypothetical protein YPC_3145 [Yersinia pestis biovar Medievalis str. Harbin 35]AEL73136.1 hypothetical protein A1122_12520 [Yersinia pestis A1122]AIN12970.1 hypothetical protein DJ40_3589 [Yersinia pseudotuberculosis]AJI90030.1 hypothetical protein CH59_3590 [Yersinia pestis]AJI97646.1 hypothetical protein BZ18_2139 [Yersinia pestis Pestoides F]AJJ54237.1 hypothetical protein BZ17_3728 [Yersinia pseudotuberculosis IP 32953]AJJ58913.1 hypothetical protein BZ22_1754 [Yersinia pseudotubercul
MFEHKGEMSTALCQLPYFDVAIGFRGMSNDKN